MKAFQTLLGVGILIWTAPLAAQQDTMPEAPTYEEIGYGETVSNFLTMDDPVFESDSTSYKIYVFEGGAGDSVTIHLSSADFNAQLIVVDSAYNPLADDRDSGGSCNAYVTTVLPDSAFYIIYVNGTDPGEVGQFQLTVQHGIQPKESDAPCRGYLNHRGVLWVGAAVEGSLGPDNPTMRNEYYDVWMLLPSSTGQAFTVDLISEDFDAALILVRGFREILNSNDDGGGGCNSRIVHTPTNQRPHRLVVVSRGERKPGNYVLRITAGSQPLLTEPPCTP